MVIIVSVNRINHIYNKNCSSIASCKTESRLYLKAKAVEVFHFPFSFPFILFCK